MVKKTGQGSRTPSLVPPAVIKRFAINGLHGDRDLQLAFRAGAKIIVADNGSGKTTLLNALYAVLSGNLRRLSWLEFETIDLEFVTGQKIKIGKHELPDPIAWAMRAPELERFRGLLSEQDYRLTILLFERSPSFEIFRDQLYQNPAIARSPISPYELSTVLRDVRRRTRDPAPPNEQMKAKLQSIKREFPFEIIFLPTYRRVEEDLVSLGLSGEVPSRVEKFDRHIFFGMADVSERLEQITRAIIQTTAESYRMISGRMVDQLIKEGFKTSNVKPANLQRQDAVDLVLRRLDKTMTPVRKEELARSVQPGQAGDSELAVLAYVLSNLIDVYDQQRSKDDQIKRFVAVANRYLVDKKLKYDEVRPHIDVYDKRESRKIALDRLSSGEKQLVSMLSRLYLADQQKYAIIVDEPELSLSIGWQRTLLPDLLGSDRCAFLLAATHSPFIFENALDSYASGFRVKMANA